ncbi:MAG: DNA cytosine methyltransferase [Lachnospiraceae bacterium]|nr:DNA cytosine methyltransferase [Lachnospiraceae bacterium]
MNKELIIDCFAGGGGASVGIEMALGRQVDIAINHDDKAILMHKTNHRHTIHLTEDIFSVDLEKYTKGQPVGLLWASPDCRSFSKAKGSAPRSASVRMLPWAVYKHAKALLPNVIIMENVEEIQQWGPLDDNGQPIKEKMGEEYNLFIESMKRLGYAFDSKELVAADYGAPTTRKRWYAIFRRDGRPIVWPKATHSKDGLDGLKKWVPASEVLDFTNVGKSIFGRKRPLAEKTLNRIAMGIKKYVVEDPEPFIVTVNHGGENFRGQKTDKPMPTITSKHGFGVVSFDSIPLDDKAAVFLTKFYNTCIGQSVKEPLHTITTSPGHFGQVSVRMVKVDDLIKAGIDADKAEKCTEVSNFIVKYYGCGEGQSVNEPLHTITTKDRFALITVLGNKYAIVDIYLRMLTAEELKLAQGFPKDYIISRDYRWRDYPVKEQVARIGNSVVPIMAQKLVESNVGYMKMGERQPSPIVYTLENGQVAFA